jgi:hypothetical protein
MNPADLAEMLNQDGSTKDIESIALKTARLISQGWRSGNFRSFGGVVEGMTPIIRAAIVNGQRLIPDGKICEVCQRECIVGEEKFTMIDPGILVYHVACIERLTKGLPVPGGDKASTEVRGAKHK